MCWPLWFRACVWRTGDGGVAARKAHVALKEVQVEGEVGTYSTSGNTQCF